MENIKHDVTKARSQIDVVRQEYEIERTHRLHLESQVDELRQDKSDAEDRHRSEVEALSSQLHVTKAELDSITNVHEESERQHSSNVASLMESLEFAKRELNSLKTRLQQSEENDDDLRKKYESLALEKEKTISNLRHDLDMATRDLQEKDKDLMSAVSKLESVEAEQNGLQDILAELNSTVQSMTSKMEEVKSNHEAEVQDLNEEISSREEDISQLQEEIRNLRQTEIDLQDQVCLMEDKYQVTCEELSTLKAQLEEITAEKEALVVKQQDFQDKILSLTEANNEAGEFYRQDVESLTIALESKTVELTRALARLKKIDDDGAGAAEAVQELRRSLEYLKKDNEEAATTYWKEVQMLTSELQSKEEDISVLESEVCALDEEIRNRKNVEQDLAEELLRSSTVIDELKSEIASQAMLLDCSESYRSRLDHSSTDLRTKIVDLEVKLSEANADQSFLQESIEQMAKDKLEAERLAREEMDALKELVQRQRIAVCGKQIQINGMKREMSALETIRLNDTNRLQIECNALKEALTASEESRKSLTMKSCSEVFSLVKRVTVLDSLTSKLEDERNDTSTSINELQVSERQLKERISDLEAELLVVRREKLKLEEEVEQNMQYEHEEEKLLTELVEKTRQIKIQNNSVDQLHEELATLVGVVKHLEKDNEELRNVACIEKDIAKKATADASDARMELNMVQKKYNSLAITKDSAFLKSESMRSTLARSLLHANAVIASLRVQMKDRGNGSDLRDELDKAKMVYSREKEELCRIQETVRFLQMSLQEKDAEVMMQSQEIQKLTGGMVELRHHSSQMQHENKALQTRHEQLVSESNRLRKDIFDLEMTLRKAEDCAEDACSSLELAQQSEEGLREKFFKWRKILKEEVSKLKRVDAVSTIEAVAESPLRQGSMNDLEYELSSITDEMESLSALVEKRSSEIDQLHEMVTDLADKLGEKEDNANLLVQENEALQISLASHEEHLRAIEADCQAQISDLQKLVLSSRAAFVVLFLRKRRLQETVALEKSDLLKNIENLSARLLSMEDLQNKTDENNSITELSLKKMILKLRAEFLVKHLDTVSLEKEVEKLKASNMSIQTVLAEKEDQIKELRSTILKFQGTIESLQREKNQMNLANGTMQLELEAMNETIVQKSCFSDELKKTAVSMRNDLNKKNTLIKFLESRVESEVSTRENLDEKLIGLSAIVQNMELDSLKKNDSIHRLESTALFLENKLQAEIEEKKRLHCELKCTVEARDVLCWRVEQLHVQNERLEIENENCIADFARLRNEIEDQQERNNFELEQHHARYEKLEIDLSLERESVAKLSSENEALNIELSARQEKVDVLELEKKTMSELVSNLEVRLRQNESALHVLNSEHSNQLNDMVKSLQDENRGLIIALAECHQVAQNERDRARGFETMKNTLEKERSNANNEISALQKVLESNQTDLLALADEKRNLEINLQHLELDVTKYQEKLHLFESGSQNDTAEIRRLEDTNATLSMNMEETKQKIAELVSRQHDYERLTEELERRKIQAKEQERHIMHLEETIEISRQDSSNSEALIAEKESEIEMWKESLADRELKIAKLEKETKSLRKAAGKGGEGNMPDAMVNHLSSVKAAFHTQRGILEDLKLSEIVLSKFMDEVTGLAVQAEKETLELSDRLNTIEDLLIRPSSCLASLDLAGLDSLKYLHEVRFRLEDMASLAYTTSVEIKHRQTEFNEWRAKRVDVPSIPITPPPNKPLKRVLFEPEANTIVGPVGPPNDIQNKMAGARLMCCVLEKHSKMELASAFRRWTCCSTAIGASDNHKETAIALAQQLEQTREKLLVLKTHLQEKKSQGKKPRLKRILDRLDGNNNKNGNEHVHYAAGLYNNQSFEI